MMVDASALVAILAREPEEEALLDRLLAASKRVTHPVTIYETVQAISRLNAVRAGVGLADVEAFLKDVHLTVVALDPATAAAALDAFARYGRGHHPAKLNMGDCFSYACAKLRGFPLLYKGEDFALTDLA